MLNLIKKLLTSEPKPVSETKPEPAPKNSRPTFSPLAAQTELKLIIHEAEDLQKTVGSERMSLVNFKAEETALKYEIKEATELLYVLRSKHEDGNEGAKAEAVKVHRNLERLKRSLELKENAVDSTERLITSLVQAVAEKEDLATELEHRIAEYRNRELVLEKEAQRAELSSNSKSGGANSNSLEALEREQKLREMNQAADAMPEAVSLADIDPFAGLEERDLGDPKNP